MKDTKILISAYAFDPDQGSEPGVGWNVACEVAKYNQVWVFTSNVFRASIEIELDRHPRPQLKLIYLDPFGWVFNWDREGKLFRGSVYFHYYLWQIWAYFVARKLHQEINFDVVHHVTFGKYSIPSFLAFLPIPFVWGPVGGAEVAPRSFWRDFGFKGQVHEWIRGMARRLGEQDPFVRLTAQRSVVAITATPETASRLKCLGAKRVELTSGQTGINQGELDYLNTLDSEPEKTFCLISISRLLHWKGTALGIKAFAQANLPDTKYMVIGDGPERTELEKLAIKLGIAPQVTFLGSLSRSETFRTLAKCHVLVHPSLHDFSPTVCVEAMAAGRPVICLDLGGPAVQITEDTGFKIPAHTPEQVVQEMAAAMVQLAKNPELQLQMGKAGQKRVNEVYSWQSKGKYLSQLYQEILSTKE